MATNHTTTPSRRGLLMSAAATAAAVPTVAAAVAVPAAVAGADADLIGLCADWRRAMNRNAVVVDRLSDMHERDWSEEDHADWNETGEAVSDLERRVFETRATTLAGVKAKAGVLDRMAELYGIPAEPEYAASLVADVMALTGGAS